MTEGEIERLAPAVVGYWRLTGVVRGFFFVLAGLPLALPLVFAVGAHPAFYIAAAAVVVGSSLWGLLTARLRYERTGFRVDPSELLVRHGLVIHHELVIPVVRMQHVDLDRGPVERLFGLARLSVYTAGGRSATVQIPGLLPERAAELRAFILDAYRDQPDE
jgi:uncharacterized protein